MEPIISFQHYGFQYYTQSEPTLHDICLDIYPGEKIVLVGPSGSGNSTLGCCINGLIPFAYKGESTGSLRVDGLEPKKASLFELSKKVGTVLQDSDGQFIGLNVGEDVAFALENDNVPVKNMHERVRQIAAMVDMDQLLESNPFELSGGQKQRVSLAGVLIDDVDILLFDEPLANLDPKTGKKAIEMIDEISRRGKTVLIIEHRLEDVLHCPADRLVVMGDGRILMDDTPDKVLASSILIEHGIREPLYLTACKYAGVQVSADMKPASLDTFDTQACRERLHRWFEANLPVREAVNDKPLLEVKDVCFSYDGKRQILNHINACVHEGEMLSIVGKNGAGKSTLAKVIVGFEEPDEGAVLLKGEDLKPYSISERARFTGIVLQNPNQMISKNLIYDEIALGLRIRQLPEAEIEEKVTKVLKICGLSEFRKWPISALSYGQKKRVTIASILVLNPEILILDEPTAGQDYAHYSDIMEFLKTLNENGQTIILITHDMHLMLEYTERAIVLADSEKIADEEAWKVLCDPALADRANLKETSLFNLAQKTGFEDPLAFVECFIRYDRQVRNHEA